MILASPHRPPRHRGGFGGGVGWRRFPPRGAGCCRGRRTSFPPRIVLVAPRAARGGLGAFSSSASPHRRCQGRSPGRGQEEMTGGAAPQVLSCNGVQRPTSLSWPRLLLGYYAARGERPAVVAMLWKVQKG
eukprot:scaffold420_cov404-Prasinococcus_capsulatus_cf.AAC.23